MYKLWQFMNIRMSYNLYMYWLKFVYLCNNIFLKSFGILVCVYLYFPNILDVLLIFCPKKVMYLIQSEKHGFILCMFMWSNSKCSVLKQSCCYPFDLNDKACLLICMYNVHFCSGNCNVSCVTVDVSSWTNPRIYTFEIKIFQIS